MLHSASVPTDILSELREQTRPAHEALEGKLDWTAICADRHAYRQMLARFYGVVRPWESVVQNEVQKTTLASTFEHRSKRHLLEQDLRCLGMHAGEIAAIEQVTAADIPQRSTAHLLGAAYVMEGSTLGGQVIARTVAAQLDVHDGRAVSYFSSYGSHVGSMWKQFGAALEQNLVSSADRSAAVASARDMFALMDVWLSGAFA